MAGSHGRCLGAFGHYRPNTWRLDYPERIMALGLLCKPANRYSCHAGIDLLDADTAWQG